MSLRTKPVINNFFTTNGVEWYIRKSKVITPSNGKLNIEMSKGRVNILIVSENITIIPIGLTEEGSVTKCGLRIYDGGSYVVTWSPLFRFASGITPNLTANGWDELVLECIDGNTV